MQSGLLAGSNLKSIRIFLPGLTVPSHLAGACVVKSQVSVTPSMNQVVKGGPSLSQTFVRLELRYWSPLHRLGYTFYPHPWPLRI